MKYTIETVDGNIKETLEFDGKTYEKEWKAEEYGHTTISKDFAEQLEEAGYQDEEFLERVDAAFDAMVVTDVANAFNGYN